MKTLDEQSDDLLRAHGFASPGAKRKGFWLSAGGEEQARRRQDFTAVRKHRWLRYVAADSSAADLLAEELADVVRRASLTPTQAEILALRADGRTCAEIGAARGHSKQGTAAIHRQALKKIRRAKKRSGLVGMWGVYWALVHRQRGDHARFAA